MTAEPRVMVGYLATCPSPQEVVAKLRAEVKALRREVAELHAEVRRLRAGGAAEAGVVVLRREPVA